MTSTWITFLSTFRTRSTDVPSNGLFFQLDYSSERFIAVQFCIFAILNESRFQEWEKDPSREIEYWHWGSNGCKIGTFCVGVDTKKVMTMVCWWWWGWGWWWWWWWWRFDDAGEVTFAGKLKPPPEGQAKLLGAYPITIPLFLLCFVIFSITK